MSATMAIATVVAPGVMAWAFTATGSVACVEDRLGHQPYLTSSESLEWARPFQVPPSRQLSLLQHLRGKFSSNRPRIARRRVPARSPWLSVPYAGTLTACLGHGSRSAVRRERLPRAHAVTK